MGELFLVPYVRSVWQSLADRLGPTGHLAIFGAGAHTRWLLSTVGDLPAPRIDCILDDNPIEKALNAIPVRRPDEVDVERLDVILLSSDRWEPELAARVNELWGNRVEVVRLYESLPRGPYDKTDDRTEALAKVRDRAAPASTIDPGNPCRVVFVSDQPGSREAKMGYALRHVGWEAVLLHRKAPSFEAGRYFDTVRPYRHAWEALRIACGYEPTAYHVMVYGDYRTAALFLRHRPGVVVVDSYDLIAGMLSDDFLDAHPDFSTQIEVERRCLEEADGLCCRSREVEFLKESRGYRTAQALLFPDGCWNRPLSTRRPFPPDQLHTVYAGHMPMAGAREASFSGHGSKLWLGRTLAEQGVHFHLYPWCDLNGRSFEEVFQEYRELERTTPFFHLHQPVPVERLIAELARYDLAVFVYNEFIEASTQSDPDAPGGLRGGGAKPDALRAEAARPVRNYTTDKFRVAAANKLFDFIDAGLPVVHTAAEGSFLSELLDRHGIRIEIGDVDPRRWGEFLGSLDLDALRARACRAREDYDVRRHIHELTGFYEALHANHPTRAEGDGATATCGLAVS